MKTSLCLALLVSCGPRPVDSVSISGGGDARQKALAAAVLEADRIWRAPAFWQLVESHVWIPHHGADPITGAQVRSTLEAHRPNGSAYDVVWFLGRNPLTAVWSSATAQASPCDGIEILRRRIPAETLINTVAHENTHLVPRDDAACTARYQDRGYTELELPWLVSYGIGDLAQCFASSGGDAAVSNACFAQVVNADYDCRTYRKCCGSGDPTTVPANIRAARTQAQECRRSCELLLAECEWHRPHGSQLSPQGARIQSRSKILQRRWLPLPTTCAERPGWAGSSAPNDVSKSRYSSRVAARS